MLNISVTIFIFTSLFIIFSYSKTEPTVGSWVIITLLFAFILGLATPDKNNSSQRVHPSYLVAKYSKYGT